VSDRLLRRIQPEQIRELALLVVLLLIVAFFATQIPNYVSGRTFTRLTTSIPIVVVVGVGLTLVVLTRNIDLSIGAIVGATAYGMGSVLTAQPGLNPLLAIAICILVGGLLGAVNGVIVAYGRVPAIVATLGTLAIFRAVLVTVSGGKPVTVSRLPDWLADLNAVNLLSLGDVDIRVLFPIAIAVVILFQLVLRYLPFGRRLFAIGSNPDAATTAGLPVQRDVFTAFVLCGAISGLGGFMYLARFGNIEPAAGLGLELDVVAAVVVGGVNIFGGSGSMIGVLLGASVLALIDQGLARWAVVSEFIRGALLGLLILLAVASDRIVLDRLRAAQIRVNRDEALRSIPAVPEPGAEATGV
jgi:rhamnose transport system permease protein